MNRILSVITLAAVLTAALATAQPTAQAPSTTKGPDAPTLSKLDPKDRAAVERTLLDVAAAYKTYERVSDRSEWSPLDCRINPPAGVQESSTRDPVAHGRKLYFLYAADAKAYDEMSQLTMPGREPPARPWTNPVGQIVVKEAFKPVEVDAKDVPAPSGDTMGRKRDLPPEYARIGEKVFKAGEPAGLFVMLKLDPARDGADAGWIYATVSADRKSVRYEGASGACFDCHKQTNRDRLYGHRRFWPMDKQGQRVPPTKDVEPPPSK